MSENREIQCDSSTLNVAVDSVLEIFQSHAEEVQELNEKKCNLEVELENLKKTKRQLEMEKSEIDGKVPKYISTIQTSERLISRDHELRLKAQTNKSKIFTADITRLKLQNSAYQKEHTNLRNAITVVRFQIEKIKESIASAKANDLKALEDFEKAVDDITEKFRSGPAHYDRKLLLQKIEEEKARRDALTKQLEELTNSYENFNREKGLRMRTDENEELLNCVLPDSPLACYIEMTKTLDEVICGIKNLTDSQ